MQKADWNKAAKLLRIVFESATESITAFLPDEGRNSSFFVASHYRNDRKLASLLVTIEKIYSRIRSAELQAAMLASGISLTNLKELRGKFREYSQ